MNSAFQLMTSGVGARDLESLRRDIGGVHFGLRQLFSERDCNAAGAGAHVHNARSCHSLNERQHSFDHVLSFWTRNKHSWSDDKIHPPEFLMPRDVLRWNALGTLVEGLIVTRFLVVSSLAIGMGV